MSLFLQLFGAALLALIFALILYVIFGQVTVRKLRKNPETRDALGFEYASGTDIINVIKVLAISKTRAEKLRKGSMSFLHADVDLIYKHTNRLDRVLAKAAYWFLIFGVGSLITVLLLDYAGIFN